MHAVARVRSTTPPRACSRSTAITARPLSRSPTCSVSGRQASTTTFPSKEVALEIVCMQGVEDFYERARAIASGAGTASEKTRRADPRAPDARCSTRADYVRVFLNERQYLPRASRQRIAKWSRGIERVIDDVIKDGVRRGEFRRRHRPAAGHARRSWACSTRCRPGTARKNASLERIADANSCGLTINGLANPKARAR